MDAAQTIRIAILDLYDNTPNQGMRCLKEILFDAQGALYSVPMVTDIFETRYKAEIPDLSYDIYISSGGPGSPFDGEGKLWEKRYFHWMDSIFNHNLNSDDSDGKKYIFAICHSFEMMARFFKFAHVTRRRSTSFGIMPVHKTEAGKSDIIFSELANPFFGADFRDWQVVQPDQGVLSDIGAEIIALEKIRPHVDLERAVMGVRISPEIAGVQFHPEADRDGMLYHFLKPERKAAVIDSHGPEKYDITLHRIQDPNYLQPTRETVIPNFINNAIENLRPEAVFSMIE